MNRNVLSNKKILLSIKNPITLAQKVKLIPDVMEVM